MTPEKLISIHAPRAGGDQDTSRKVYIELISIHAPRAGGDLITVEYETYDPISIHAPRAGGDFNHLVFWIQKNISIHAPRAGGDRENSDHYPDFQIILVWLFVSGRIWLLILNISQSI